MKDKNAFKKYLCEMVAFHLWYYQLKVYLHYHLVVAMLRNVAEHWLDLRELSVVSIVFVVLGCSLHDLKYSKFIKILKSEKQE